MRFAAVAEWVGCSGWFGGLVGGKNREKQEGTGSIKEHENETSM